MKVNKLELTWVGKDERHKPEPRVLIYDASLSHHAQSWRRGDQFDNRLIFGDNLLGLKALQQEFSNRIKCILLDPPYNTGAAWEHYDDGLEHSLWLSLMQERLKISKELLADDGSIWICLDDNEVHYLKVICDEIFGRSNFLATVVWQHSVQGKGYSGKFSVHHNYLLSYRKSEKFVLRDLPRTEEHNVNYSNPDNDPNGPWRAGDVRNALFRPNLIYDLKTPSGKTIKAPAKGWRWSRETMADKIRRGQIIFKDDETRIVHKIYLQEQEGRVPETVWLGQDVGTTREASTESKDLFGPENAFATPKPERLIERVLRIATNPGDLVLDSFAGSGTTGAVAHKMGRSWIMIEMGEHCHTHIVPRLKKVVDGTDDGGISQAVGWKGGGGYRYYRLAPSLIKKDVWGNEVINSEYNPEMVAEAVCKLEGFVYAPSDTEFWRQGHSTENDFIYVTTQTLTAEQLERISDEVGPKSTLLICCGAFRAKDPERFKNVTLKKIPKTVLDKCDWDKDDYSLKISKLPMTADNAEDEEIESGVLKRGGKGKATAQGGLFDEIPAREKKSKK